jgi:hypothetical protein
MLDGLADDGRIKAIIDEAGQRRWIASPYDGGQPD